MNHQTSTEATSHVDWLRAQLIARGAIVPESARSGEAKEGPWMATRTFLPMRGNVAKGRCTLSLGEAIAAFQAPSTRSGVES